MLSKSQIERMIDGQADERLIRRILANGRGFDADRLVAQLDRFSARVVALSLAVQRLDELTYGPDGTLRRLGRDLLTFQRSDGFFSGDRERSRMIATAAAVNALRRLRDRAFALGEDLDSEIADALHRGLNALQWVQQPAVTTHIDETAAEIMHWLLEPTEIAGPAPNAAHHDQPAPLFAHAA